MTGELEDGEVISDSLQSDTDSDGWTAVGVLPVAVVDDNFDPDVAPETGEEYLRLVRYQAGLLPFAIQAQEVSIDDRTGKEAFEGHGDKLALLLEHTDPCLLPSTQFVIEFTNTFLQGCIKEEFEITDGRDWLNLGDEEGWRHFLYPKDHSIKCPRLESSSFQPDQLLYSRPSQQQLMQLIKYHTKWLDATIEFRQYQFIIRILQCLDPQMTSWQLTKLRSLAMQVATIRKHYLTFDSSALFYANGIIVAIAKRFGQTDFLLGS